MTVREVIAELNKAMDELANINTSNTFLKEYWQTKVNKAYNILYDLRKDLRNKR